MNTEDDEEMCRGHGVRRFSNAREVSKIDLKKENYGRVGEVW